MIFIPLGLVLCGLICVLVGAVMPVSKYKGQARLASSALVGIGIFVGALVQPGEPVRLLPRAFALIAGLLLAWVGWRKYRQDPDGRTPLSKIL